jgi:hypothetical protein
MADAASNNDVGPRYAPEVLREPGSLMLAHNESEGLQYHEASEGDYLPEKHSAGNPEKYEISPNDVQCHLPKSSQRRKRSRWLAVSIATSCALLSGLGIGVGIGYASHTSHGNAPTPSSASPVIATTPKPTPTSSGVISGTTGIANFQCNSTSTNNTYTTSSSANNGGIYTFTEDCFTDYETGLQTLANRTTVNVTDVGAATTYSFQSCMDNCVALNAKTGVLICQAVTYTANLTFAVQMAGSNCWLKNARGLRHNGRGDLGWNYNLMASAYLDL